MNQSAPISILSHYPHPSVWDGMSQIHPPYPSHPQIVWLAPLSSLFPYSPYTHHQWVISPPPPPPHPHISTMPFQHPPLACSAMALGSCDYKPPNQLDRIRPTPPRPTPPPHDCICWPFPIPNQPSIPSWRYHCYGYGVGQLLYHSLKERRGILSLYITPLKT